MFTEREMLEKELRNRERAWNDFDGLGDTTNYSEIDHAGMVELVNLFRKRLQVVELENTRLKIRMLDND